MTRSVASNVCAGPARLATTSPLATRVPSLTCSRTSTFAASRCTHLADQRQPGNHRVFLRRDLRARALVGGHGEPCRQIAGTEILGQRGSHQGVDGGEIEDVH